jgi:hypothetical protein
MQATQLTHLSNEAGVYLGRAGGQEGSDLQEFAEVLPPTPFTLKFLCNDEMSPY